ncbi:MAG: serine/threonine-protein kinase [Myxococcota bacterium]
MSNDLFRRAKPLVIAALERPREARSAYVVEACDGDPELKQEVESLLAHHEATGDSAWLERGVADLLQDAASDVAREPAPARLGPYEVLSALGEGGMGTVYRCRQTHPIDREVAVKVIRRGLDTDRVIERFDAERRSLARMDHPHIATLLDAGATEDGRPYVVMPLIAGEPITDFAETHRLAVPARLGLFLDVCRAVRHAHDRGVIHRDLKPSNLLVALADGEPRPTIIDFGIAKALGPDDTDLTREGQIIGTPAYMSPEQQAGAPVDVRADVYALGVVLRELLDPCAPLPADLDLVARTAAHDDPTRRYASVAALIDDLERFIAHRPVTARPDTLGYRLRKLAQRRPLGVALAVMVALFAGSAAAFTAFHVDRLAEERDRARQAEQRASQEAATAEEVTRFLEELFTEVDPAEGGAADTTARELLDAGAERIRSELVDQPEVRGRLLLVLARMHHALALYERATALIAESLQTLRGVLDDSDPLIIDALLVRALVEHDTNELAAAEATGHEALARITAAGTVDTNRQADALSGLAITIRARGRPEEAVQLMEQAIGLWRELPDKEADVAWATDALGYILFRLGRKEESRQQHQASVDVQRRLYDGDHPHLVNSLNNLGMILRHLGDDETADVHLTEALAMARRLWSGDHQLTARALFVKGNLLLDQGDVEAARAMLEEAYAMNVRVLGPEHRHTQTLREGLARLEAVSPKP